ncbi:MAG: hypothetical protein ACR2QM_18355 [Longimicrobiales bacterium]
MGKRFLFLAIVVNAVLIAFSAVQTRAAQPVVATANGGSCCIGGQCVDQPGYICMFYPSCRGSADCGVFVAPQMYLQRAAGNLTPASRQPLLKTP